MKCVKCGKRLTYNTALDWDVSGSSHRYICHDCAVEEGIVDEDDDENENDDDEGAVEDEDIDLPKKIPIPDTVGEFIEFLQKFPKNYKIDMFKRETAEGSEWDSSAYNMETSKYDELKSLSITIL